MSFVAIELSAENTFSAWIAPSKNAKIVTLPSGFLDLIITGTWSGTLTIQKRYYHGILDGYTDIFDGDLIDSNLWRTIEDYSENVEFRIGFKSGDYTSGTALIQIEQ
ncbi:MAG: hypothetical protein J7L15_01825 [Clostridiales bacterium]|nr:hypothetical protein [Clostridiales bacterium]